MSSFFLFIHIISGSVAVISLIICFIVKKGGQRHRQFGNYYVISMVFALVAGLILSVMTSNLFLLLVAMFSAYFVYTGWRLAANRINHISNLDKSAIFSMIASSILMLVIGTRMYLDNQDLSIVILVFAFVGGGFALVDLNRIRPSNKKEGSGKSGWPTGRERMVLHVTRISGACISTLTAVFVVNIKTNPEFIAWLLPTVVITPLISYWVRRIRNGRM